jgi:hypothetical protein
MGRPNRFLVGLGTSNEATTILSQGIKPDIFDRYLTGLGPGSWPFYNSPDGAYVNIVAANADSIGAVPMFTFYQMATNGDGNLSGLHDHTFMTTYWSNAVLLFQRLALYGKPALVNFEPDFWGYAQQQAPNGDPTRLQAFVTDAPDCTALPNDITGMARCLIVIAHKYAPQALVGFPPSTFGAPLQSDVIAFMNRIGANTADFVIIQTLDRDAGCFEALPSYCNRPGTGWYWDESNATHPNFLDHLAQSDAFGKGIGLPLLWWQTPMGVPAATSAGGFSKHWRDNRAHYFLTHADQLTAIGGLGAVFSTGENNQTDITTDGGQFQTLSAQYLAHPVPLP